MQSAVAVVGSVNLDIVVSASRRPGPGETVIGVGVQETLGGKGANQALASALVAPTGLVAAVGDDHEGRGARTRLADEGVEVRALRSSSLPTGRAYITLTDDTENSILVVPLANSQLSAEHVESSLESLRPQVVLCQLEVPVAAVAAAAHWCGRAGARFLLNASPIADVDQALLAAADPLIVNRHEASQLCGRDEHEPPEALAAQLAARSRSVVVTDGARGAVVASSGSVELVAAPEVAAVDTTGAGDAFAGTLAARLAQGATLRDAAADAAAAASRIVQLARSER